MPAVAVASFISSWSITTAEYEPSGASSSSIHSLTRYGDHSGGNKCFGSDCQVALVSPLDYPTTKLDLCIHLLASL